MSFEAQSNGHTHDGVSFDAKTQIYTARTPAEIQKCLVALRAEHDAATAALDELLSSHDDLSRQLRRLDLSRAKIGTLAVAARGISQNLLSGPALTAGRISDAVEQLDLEQERVKATLEVVEQVAELKSCVLGVMGSMGAPQDWETAAEYIHRASRIPVHVVESGFAEQVVPTAEVPDAPRVTLDNAAQALCGLFLREFDKAVAESDGAKITRFFKMFPLIGRSKEGLDAYGKYVCQGVAQRARTRLQTGPGSRHAEGQVYTAALTKLFEHIAQVVDGHRGLVERHYGQGTMLQVMERLHREADVQGGIVLDTWAEERAIDRRLTDVKSYAYSFLVQSFLSAPKTFGATPRTGSPAAGASTNGARDEHIDMKEVDRILAEIGTMLGHWSLYVRFVASHSSHDDEHLAAPDFIKKSNLPKKISKLLAEPFTSFATFFLRRSVERAFQLDEQPPGLHLDPSRSVTSHPPFITSAVDDVMYVVNQIAQRSLAAAQADVAVTVLGTVGRVLGSDFIPMIQRKMRDESFPRAAVQGAAPPDDKVVAFMVLINNLDVSIDYVRRIVNDQLDDAGKNPARSLDAKFPMGRDAASVRTALKSLDAGFNAKATELINDGLQVAFQQLLKPRLRPLLTEAFRDTDYSLEEARADDSDDDDNVKARTRFAWDALVVPAKRILTERAAARLLTTTTSALANLLERRIWSYYGRVSEAGAVALEQDVADVANAIAKGENFRLREVFTRCVQIVTIMNLEDDEWDAIRADENADQEWVLTASERQRARAIVKDRE